MFKKKSLLNCVTEFNKKKFCHTESLCLRKNCQKLLKTVKNGPVLTVFDRFDRFSLKHSHSVRQTFVILNIVTQCDKLLVS